MVYNEVKGDLFNASYENVLVHCISADFALRAGIAKKFASMGVRKQLIETGSRNKWEGKGYCIITDSHSNDFKGNENWTVANLITKRYAFGKPTYETLRQSLEQLKQICEERNYTNLSMPAIGCGIDRLEWSKVSEMIKDIFKNTNVNITVYLL